MHITLDWMMWQFGRPHSHTARRGRRRKYPYELDEICRLADDRLREIANKEAQLEYEKEKKRILVEMEKSRDDGEKKKLQLELDKKIIDIQIEIYLDIKQMVEEFLREEEDMAALLLLI